MSTSADYFGKQLRPPKLSFLAEFIVGPVLSFALCVCLGGLRLAVFGQTMSIVYLVIRGVNAETTKTKIRPMAAVAVAVRVVADVAISAWMQVQANDLIGHRPYLHSLVTALICYANACVSDYMVHRFIWHAHWSRDLHGASAMFWATVKANYVHHYLAHHKLCHNADNRRLMEQLLPLSPKAEAGVFQIMDFDDKTRYGVECTYLLTAHYVYNVHTT